MSDANSNDLIDRILKSKTAADELINKLEKDGADLLKAGAIDPGLPDDGELMQDAAKALRELTAPVDDGELELALIAYLHYVDKGYMQSGIMDAIKPTFERLARAYKGVQGDMKQASKIINDQQARIEELEIQVENKIITTGYLPSSGGGERME